MKEILLDENSVRAFAHGDHPDFEEVEVVKDYESLYKDSCLATTIAKYTETGDFYALDWYSYESHYGHGEHTYPNQSVYKVTQVEKTVVTKEWVKV